MSRTFPGGGNGVNTDNLQTGLSAAYALTSISVWVYATSNLNNNAPKIVDSASDILDLQGNFVVTFGFTTTSGEWSVTGEVNFPVNQWMHLVVTYDSTSLSNAPSIYYNGSSQPVTVAVAPAGSRSAASTWYIGNRADLARCFQGSIFEVAIWNALLSAQDVTNLYKGQTPLLVQKANLQGFWPLNGSSPEPDLSGNNRNATVTGTTVGTDPPFPKCGTLMGVTGPRG